MREVEYESGKQITFKDEYGNTLVGTMYGVSKERDGNLYHIVVEDTMFMVPEDSIV